MSVSQFVIIGNWILEGRFKEKWTRLKSNPGIWLFTSVFMVHIVGLLNTTWDGTHLNYAMNDLRIKLPILLLPVFIGSSEPLDRNEIRRIIYFFIGAVLVGTILTNMKLLSPFFHADFRNTSQFISHIRFSLMIVLSVFFLFYYSVSQHYKTRFRLLHWLLILWFLASIVLLRSLTAVVVIYCTTFILFFVYQKKLNATARIIMLMTLALIPSFFALQIKRAVEDFYHVHPVNLSSLPSATACGNPYIHDTLRKEFENGHLIHIYVCDEELRCEWNKKSVMKYDSLDLKGNFLRETLIRYMTSKGYTKDSSGINKLTQHDILNVENSIANYIYYERKGLYPRIYETIWEFDHYIRFGNPSGYSTTQRIEFLKTAGIIIKENFWFGVGTGDVRQAFDDTYNRTQSPLDKAHRLRAHNQFVTLLLTFGIFGFLWILFVLFYIPYKMGVYKNFIFLSSFVVAMLSWLNEDTLETQAGVTFFLIFIIIILFGVKYDRQEPETT